MKALKFLFLSTLVFASLVFFQLPAKTVFAQQPVEHIDNFQVDIDVQPNGQIYIIEDIDYDSGIIERHGIFRHIPYQYTNTTGKFNLRISDIAVVDEKNQPINFTKSTSDGEVVLKIGDAAKTFTGKRHYQINYAVDRAINFFPDHDELYWNAIGSKWEFPIYNSSVKINLPAPATQVECFVGRDGTQSNNCGIAGPTTNQPNLMYIQTLNPGEGFTIVAGVPAGTITKPTTQQKVLDVIKDNYIVGLPVIVLIFMFFLWLRFGKDAKGRGTIVAQFEPPTDLSPLYMGTLVDGKFDNRDFAAELIYLAVKGYIKIEKIETKKLLFFKGSDYKLTRLKDTGSDLPKQTQQLFYGLFLSKEIEKSLDKLFDEVDLTQTDLKLTEVNLSSLKTNRAFGMMVKNMHSEVFKELKTSGYYKYNPNIMRGIFIAIGVILGLWGGSFVEPAFGILGIISIVVASLIIIIFGFLMPARTQKGAEMREYILGLKLYLSVAEKDRLAFANAPDKKPERFEALLPYAVALGVEKEWAKQFEGIYNQQPTWYNDSTGTAFNVALLSSSIGDFSSSMQSAVTSMNTAASGGSGFGGGGAGGGGGGGGGGGW